MRSKRLQSGELPAKHGLLLVCSTGGHLLQLHALREVWEGEPRFWVTFSKSDARALLRDETWVAAHGPTSRTFPVRAALNACRNLVLAVRLVAATRPAVILTTGAGVAVPFAWVGRAFGANVVFVESFTRIDGPSLSLRLVAPVTARIYAQWPELQEALPRARYVGNVFSGT